MDHLGLWLIVPPLLWGLYKCSMLAQRPTTNRKSVYALAAMLAVWLVLLVIVFGRGVPEGSEQLLFAAAVLFTGGPMAASVLAALGLREIHLSRRTGQREQGTIYVQGTWQAIGALLLAAALLVPFGIYAGISFSRSGERAVAAPTWTTFMSPGGDFEVEFPGKPEQEPAQQTSSIAVPARAVSATLGRSMYMVTTRDDASIRVADADAAFKRWEKAIQDKFPGSVTERTRSASGSSVAMEIRGASPAKAVAYRFRAVILDRRMYIVAATMPEDMRQADVADRFFQSFKLRASSSSL